MPWQNEQKILCMKKEILTMVFKTNPQAQSKPYLPPPPKHGIISNDWTLKYFLLKYDLMDLDGSYHAIYNSSTAT